MSPTISSKRTQKTGYMTEQSLASGEASVKSPIANPWHTTLVLAVVALNGYRGVMFAARGRAGFVPDRAQMYLRTMLVEVVILGIVTFGVWRHGASFDAIFGERWRKAEQVLRDAGLGLALWMAALIVVSILGSVGGHGGDSNQSIGYLLPRSSRELLLWICLSVIAGIQRADAERAAGNYAFQRGVRGSACVSGITASAGDRRVGHFLRGNGRVAWNAAARNDCARVSGRNCADVV